MKKFKKGDDFIGAGADHVTYGIHNETPGEDWGNQIEVYGDPDLRDRILRLLREDEQKELAASGPEAVFGPTGLRGDPQ